MFFQVSKFFEFFMAPAHVMLAALFVGIALTYTRYAKWGRRLATFGALLLAAIAMGPLADWLAAPLEARFPSPPEDMPAPTGIIVLGGSVDEDLSGTTHKLVFTESAQRLSAPIRLRRMYPNARLVFTGGTGSLLPGATTEADVVRQYWREIGVDNGDVIYEDRSRNTIENALFTKEIVKPQPGERWLLVTSATHMPRSMGLFRKAGFDVVAFPVDFVSTGRAWSWRPPHSIVAALRTVEISMHEWWGLLASRLTGKSDELLPAP